ncbi:hypothetical protein OAL38_01195 [bacterium]|nr:hypothetical protein [bacterium]
MQIKKVFNHGNLRWRVSTYVDGKRKQRFFVSEKLATRWMSALRADRTPEQQRDIVSAFNLASKRGVPIYQCILISPAKLKPLSIPDAVESYAKVIKQRSLRPSSLKQTQLHLSQLAGQFSNQMCHKVSSSQLEEWFHTRNWKRSTIDGVLAKIGPFFTWRIRENYFENNPCKAVKRPRSDDSPPSIFTLPRLNNSS